MEKQSYVSPGQIIATLLVGRILFSTVHFISLHAGRSIQDVLPAVPAAFLLNLLTAVPLLALLKRHQGKDPVECATNIFGRGAGVVTALFYFLLFGWNNLTTQSTFQGFFSDSVIVDAKIYAILLPLLAITVYIAVKGFESLVRFGTVVFIIYIGVLVLLTCTLIPSVRPGVGFNFLLPLFFNGPGIFLKELVAEFNENLAIIYFAFCAPYLKSGIRLGKVFAKWNLFAFLIVFPLFTLCVAVLGPFGADQNYPLQSMAAQSTVSVFDRLDSLYGMSWTMNALLTVSFFLLMQTQCMEKIGWNKHRGLRVAILGVLDTVGVFWLHSQEVLVSGYTLSWAYVAVNVVGIIVLPTILLIGDRIVHKRRVAHEVA